MLSTRSTSCRATKSNAKHDAKTPCAAPGWQGSGTGFVHKIVHKIAVQGGNHKKSLRKSSGNNHCVSLSGLSFFGGANWEPIPCRKRRRPNHANSIQYTVPAYAGAIAMSCLSDDTHMFHWTVFSARSALPFESVVLIIDAACRHVISVRWHSSWCAKDTPMILPYHHTTMPQPNKHNTSTSATQINYCILLYSWFSDDTHIFCWTVFSANVALRFQPVLLIIAPWWLTMTPD